MNKVLPCKCLPEFGSLLIDLSVRAVALGCVHPVDRADVWTSAVLYSGSSVMTDLHFFGHAHVVSVFLGRPSDVIVFLVVFVVQRLVLDLESVGVRVVGTRVVFLMRGIVTASTAAATLLVLLLLIEVYGPRRLTH